MRPNANVMEETGYRPGSPRQRLLSSLLSAGIVALVVLLAIYQTQIAPKLKEQQRNPVTFNVTGNESSEAADKAEKQPEPEKERERKPETKQPPQVRVEVETPVPPVEQPVPPVKKPAFTFMRLSRAEMAAADIGSIKRPSAGAEAAPATSGSGGGGAYGPGEGPGGAVLYNADWFRPPTDAQLGGYLVAGMPPEGWGMIACQTLERYRVDNCQILAESPRGSGYGRAVLEAAWQFQVVPPRINGKPQIGTWVRIRIDYGKSRAAG